MKIAYPLNMQLPAPAVGFAVANTEDEHISLTERGYLPAYVAPAEAAPAEAAPKARAKAEHKPVEA